MNTPRLPQGPYDRAGWDDEELASLEEELLAEDERQQRRYCARLERDFELDHKHRRTRGES